MFLHAPDINANALTFKGLGVYMFRYEKGVFRLRRPVLYPAELRGRGGLNTRRRADAQRAMLDGRRDPA
jgi:hypothetical protein